LCVFCVELCFPAVEIVFACGSRPPAFVNPEPLFGVGADHAFDGGGEVRRVRLYVAPVVSRAHQLDRRVAAKEKTPTFFVPDGTGWNHDGIRAQGERGDAGRGASQLAEEGDEDAFVRVGVEVCENAERAAFAQDA
jgi:hypothetical protein